MYIHCSSHRSTTKVVPKDAEEKYLLNDTKYSRVYHQTHQVMTTFVSSYPSTKLFQNSPYTDNIHQTRFQSRDYQPPSPITWLPTALGHVTAVSRTPLYSPFLHACVLQLTTRRVNLMTRGITASRRVSSKRVEKAVLEFERCSSDYGHVMTLQELWKSKSDHYWPF